MAEKRFSFANRTHLGAMIGLMIAMGDLCPKCHWGTRKTSKRWARCKSCGERVERISSAEAVRRRRKTLAGDA